MPTYEYECTKCGNGFDAVQSMTDDRLVKCPSCGKNGLRRLIGGGLGIIFKGSGFYVTDNRSGGNGSGHESDGGGDSSKSGDKSSTESKPESSKSEATKTGSSSSESKTTSGSKAGE